MSLFHKVTKDAASKVGTFIGDFASENEQRATNSAIKGMDLFKKVAEEKHNVAFDQAKGNLFEYIEAAKFNQNAARNRSDLGAVVTAADGRPADPADIEIVKNGKIVRQIQAKFSDSKHAAADSVSMQRKQKYRGMQRLIRKENHYVDPAIGKETTLLKKAKSLAENRSGIEGNIYQEDYKDVTENLTDELHYGNVSSGGTTLDDLQRAYDNPNAYAGAYEKAQVAREIRASASNMAAASMVTGGIASGITNMFAVFNDNKELAEAFHDVGADAIKSGIRGGATGALSTVIRYKGVKAGSALLSDSMSATVMAGGIIDGGVALYSYARGEISAEQLRDELVDTTAKAATTIYYTKAVTAIMGASVRPFIPIAVYTTASYVIIATREIIRNANLNAVEYNCLAAILEESTRQTKEAHEEFFKRVQECEERQRVMLNRFIDAFEYNIETGENYDQALYAIVSFADEAGIALQHVKLEDFSSAMKSKQTFRLE